MLPLPMDSATGGLLQADALDDRDPEKVNLSPEEDAVGEASRGRSRVTNIARRPEMQAPAKQAVRTRIRKASGP